MENESKSPETPQTSAGTLESEAYQHPTDEPTTDWVDPSKQDMAEEPKNKAEESGEAAPPEEKYSGEESPAEPVKKTGVQKRFDELTRQRREAERERDEWRAKAEGKQEQAKTDSKDLKRPKEEEFDTYEEYEEALVDYKIDLREAANASKKAESEAKQKAEKFQDEFGNVMAEITGSDEDLQEKVIAGDLFLSKEEAEIAMESENPKEVLDYLIRNQDEAYRIADLSPTGVAREIGKIEAKIAAGKSEKPAPQPKRVTKAPEPIKPIGGKEYVEKSPQDMSMDEYAEWRLKGNG